MQTRFIGSCATRTSLLTTAALALASVLGCTSPGSATPANESAGRSVRLILQITVDGLRGDLLNRYGDRFGEGGFRHLLTTGAVYANAHYQHANTETIVGHSTLATGASPDQHGMIGNVWFDREAGELAYNIEDPEHPILASREVAMKGAQLDPSQKQSRTKGRSPRSLLASTFGDELSVHTAGDAKVFGVSGKDRSAVAMAGHVGKAFWYATDSGDMVTSDYYYDAYPGWVAEWNARRRAESHAGGSWTLLHDESTYLLAASDDRPYETDLKGYGRVFPHPFGELGDPLFFTRLIASPVGDALTLEFAKALIAAEQLGRDATPDYLSISFSSVDVVNHFFGPSSLENEDIVLQLDRTLADLFQFVDAAVGLEHTLVVLSADHGTPEMPEAMAEAGLRASRLYPAEVVERANEAARNHFGIEGAVRFFFRPYLYLNREKIRTSGADPDEVEQVIATALTDADGIALAVARSALPTLTDDDLVARIRRNTHPSRSGDIYVAPEPYWFLYEKGPIAAAHGSPWRHDTFVPIIFAGPGIAAQTIQRLVHPTDVAPTLAGYLGVKPPSSAVGTPLEEVLP